MPTGNPYSVYSVVANTAGLFGNACPHTKHDKPILYDDQFDWILPPVIDSTLTRQPTQKSYYDASNPRVLGDGSDELQVHVKLVRDDGRYVLCPVFWKYDEDLNKYELHTAEMQPLDTSSRRYIKWSYEDGWGNDFE